MSVQRDNMVKIGVMVAIAAFMASVGIAEAGPGRWGGEPCGQYEGGHYQEFGKKLGLTDTQKAQAKAIFQGNRDVVQPIITNLHAEQQKLQALIHADTLDEAAIRDETARIAGIQADLNVNRAKVDAQFRAILTPAQVATLKALPRKCHKRGEAAPE